MSSANAEGSTNPEQRLTLAEIEDRDRLEAIARQGLRTYVQVDGALAEIRDRRLYREIHSSFETYVAERWGVNIRTGSPLSQGSDRREVAGPMGEELVPTLRWLMTQASGTIGHVAHELESRAADVDDRARAQLRDDVLVLDGELAVVKALLAELIDWDSELRLLLNDELPPLDTNTQAEDE